MSQVIELLQAELDRTDKEIAVLAHRADCTRQFMRDMVEFILSGVHHQATSEEVDRYLADHNRCR